jgi:tRNA-specific 2-thiouridylase
MQKNKNTKVFVGVSGGVDSSVSLALLQEQGYDVMGVFIRTWQPDFIECTWRDERRDAMRVCAHLGVPFLECDLESVYRDEVAMYMIDEYRKGRTPNPDVMCNKKVKFGGFLDFAMAHGADYVATGHYAQVEKQITTEPFEASNFDRGGVGTGLEKLACEKGVRYFLKQSTDHNKDQTYFLWTLTQDQLSKTLFPVGHLEKSEVRKLAEKYKLPTATKKDSQGVCFLGMIDMKEFLAHYIEKKEGQVLNEKGEVIGTHDGSVFITLGQRHGFTITEKGTDDKRYYVISKDIQKNTITVSDDLQSITDSIEKEEKTIHLSQVVFHNQLDEEKIYQARIRYRQQLQECTLKWSTNKELLLTFITPQLNPSKGQSCVIYDGDLCLGGGVIE